MSRTREMKDAYYFSHDSNSRNDEKILALRIKYGWEGYGIFWALIERLREAADYTSVSDYNLIAYDLRVDAAKLKSIINDFGLFAFTENGKCFYSERLNKNMELMDDKHKALSEAGKRGNEKRWAIAEKSPPDRHPIASKVKESKVKGNTDPQHYLKESNLYRQPKIPTVEKVKEVFINHGGTEEMALKFFETNSATGWFYRGSPIVNFSSLVPGFIQAWNKNNPLVAQEQSIEERKKKFWQYQ